MVAASCFHGTLASYRVLTWIADFTVAGPSNPCPVIHFAKTDFV